MRTHGVALCSLIALLAWTGCTRYIVGGPHSSEPSRDGGTTRDAGAFDAGIDTGPRADAGASDAGAVSDSGPRGPVGFFITQPFADPISIEIGGMQREGAVVRVRVRFATTQTCDTFGHVSVSIDPMARVVTLEPWIWRELESPCAPGRRELEVTRAIHGLTAGPWRVVYAGTPLQVPLDVMPWPSMCPVPLVGLGGPCEADCACEPGLACIELRDMPARVCARPCEVSVLDDPWNASCDPASTCVRSGLYDQICRMPMGPTCDAASCAPGMDCNASGLCDWSAASIGERHPCVGDADCAPARDCVGWMGPDPALRRCEIRCTSSDMRCPDGTSGECATLGVCEPFP